MKKNIKLALIFSTLILLVVIGCVKEDFDVVPDYEVDYEANISISDLKAMYSGSSLLIDTNLIVKGVVVADDASGNFYKEMFFQDTSGAISIRLDNSYISDKFPIGRMIFVKLEGLYIDNYQGVMQIGWGANVDRIPTKYTNDNKVPDVSSGGVPVEPKLLTIGELNDDDVGKLIKLENVEFLPGDTSKTYADAVNQTDENRTLKECVGGNQVLVRTSGFASFAGDSIPNGNGSVIAILGKYGTEYQLKVRSTEEINLTGDRCSK